VNGLGWCRREEHRLRKAEVGGTGKGFGIGTTPPVLDDKDRCSVCFSRFRGQVTLSTYGWRLFGRCQAQVAPSLPASEFPSPSLHDRSWVSTQAAFRALTRFDHVIAAGGAEQLPLTNALCHSPSE